MNEQTLVAVYDTAAHADAAVRELKAANVPESAISQHAKTGSMSGATRTPMVEPEQREGFWSSLFGGGGESERYAPDHYGAVYDRSIDDGATVVTVRAPADQFDRISAILEKHTPIDLDERAARYGTAQPTTTRATDAPAMRASGTAADGGTLQLSEESMSVGKRAVSGGTTRIRRYVVETPVEENVSLRTEKVTMDRRPVTDGRPVGNADFTDKTIEMTETSEEAVVSKTARVTEEVSLRKDSSERVETVKDTVRRDEVKIEQVAGAASNAARPDVNRPDVSRADAMPVVPPAQRRA